MEIEDDLLRTSEAAKFIKTSKQAIHAAAKNGRLPVKRFYGLLLFSKKDLTEYATSKWNHLSFNKSLEPNEMSVKEASKFLKVTDQAIYYFIRMKYLKHLRAGRKRSRYILFRDDVENFFKNVNTHKKGRWNYK